MTERGDVDESKRATLRRFAALGAVSPLARFVNPTATGHGDSDARTAIAGFVTTTPGAHFSKIRDDLQLGNGEAQHHLRTLVEAGAIESYRDGDYRRFYPAGQFDSFEKVALGYLRRETPRGMLIELLRTPDASGSGLAESLDVSRPTVSKYVSELESAGLLTREDGYAVRKPETVILLLVGYAASFDANAVSFAREADALISFAPADS